MRVWRLVSGERELKWENKRERRRDLRTWRPAREEREMGFFLSLSLLAAEVLPVINPFAPFPDIFYRQNTVRCVALRQRERERRQREVSNSGGEGNLIDTRKGFEVVSLSSLLRLFIYIYLLLFNLTLFFFLHTHLITI